MLSTFKSFGKTHTQLKLLIQRLTTLHFLTLKEFTSKNPNHFLNLSMLRFIEIVLIKIFDIYTKLMLYIFRFIIFDYIFLHFLARGDRPLTLWRSQTRLPLILGVVLHEAKGMINYCASSAFDML